MSAIHRLPEEVVRKIAAGEVIERPANALKELIENSLDAGATRLTVEIAGAGRQLIRVSDNGCGMSADDLHLAIQPHATSKLNDLEDLQYLSTLGFRGEALPSIAAVSHLTITSRPPRASEGATLTVTGGAPGTIAPCGAPPGTTITVRELFFNTPARAKFLKTDATERSHLVRTLEELALAFPHIGFEVLLERTDPWHLAPVTNRSDRVAALFGTSLRDQLIPLEVTAGPLQINGVIGTPAGHQLHRRFQLFFVNRRPVSHRTLTHALYEGYRGALLVDRHPVAFLWLTIDPTLVDVNVHPTKREVRFSQDQTVHEAMSRAITQTLQAHRTIPTLVQSAGAPMTLASLEGHICEPTPSYRITSAMAGVTNRPVQEQAGLAGLIPLAQLSRLYILAQAGQDLVIIDQHAAGERVLYERFWRQATEGPIPSQPLLVPETWELSGAAMKLLDQGLAVFEPLGFELAPFGRQACLVKAIPAPLGPLAHVQELLNEILGALEEERHVTQEAYREIIIRASCRAAVKANDRLAPPAMEQLLRDLARCAQPMTCPHGRPTLLRLPFHELHRHFRRT